MNNFLQRVHQWDTGAFLWLHVTRNIGYRKSVRWISHSGDGYGYALIALALFWLEPNHGPTLFVIGLSAYALEVSVYFVVKNRVKRNRDRKSTRLNSSHVAISYAVFRLKKKTRTRL